MKGTDFLISGSAISLAINNAKGINFVNKKNTTEIITKTVTFSLSLNKTNIFQSSTRFKNKIIIV